MKFNDTVKLSLNNLTHRGLRSWLTILGIVIGVAAVVAILSIGAGLQQTISSQLNSLGADVITIRPGFSRASGQGFGGGFRENAVNGGNNLTDKDILVIKSVIGVKYIDGVVSGRADISYLSESSSSVNIRGVDPLNWQQITTSALVSGRYLTQSDSDSVVIGNSIANSMFKQPLMLNTQIVIGGKSFKIAGILEKSGGFGGNDDIIYMPITSARTILENAGTNQYSYIDIKVANAEMVDEVTASLEQRLMLSRHVTNQTKDFTISSAQSTQQTISSVMGTMSLFLGGIAAISLLVGAIGIANTMFMSVMERTRQIGTLKALGTTNSEITKLFLFESAMIGLIGGLIGIFLGFISSGIVSEMGFQLTGITRGGGVTMTVITPELILFAIGFSVLIGMIAGFIPARKAAKLQPVEALRYE